MTATKISREYEVQDSKLGDQSAEALRRIEGRSTASTLKVISSIILLVLTKIWQNLGIEVHLDSTWEPGSTVSIIHGVGDELFRKKNFPKVFRWDARHPE